MIAQVVLAFQPNSFLFRVVGYSDTDRFIAPKNNQVDVVENNPTHSYMIKGRQVYQQCGRVTILYWGTFDSPFKQLNQQSIPKFLLVLENIKVLKKRLPFIMITLFLSSASLGLLTGRNTKNNSKVDLQMRWTYLHYVHYLA